MDERLLWERDGRQWPHRETSRFVTAAGLRWHVQTLAPAHRDAPVLWLLHGTGASTHSWRALMPLLARDFEVVAMDLPGHGFTGMPARAGADGPMTLPGMAQSVAALAPVLGRAPDLLLGHSAGVAIAARMCLDGLVAPQALLGVNPALLPLSGLAGQFFSPVAKLMAAAPFVPRLFAWRASDPRILQRLIDGTGSVLDPTGLALYGQLIRNPGHAAGALAMMANWDLPGLQRDLARLTTPLLQVVGANDRAVPPTQADQVQAKLPAHPLTQVIRLERLGHLAHEERADLVAPLVLQLARDVRLLDGAKAAA